MLKGAKVGSSRGRNVRRIYRRAFISHQSPPCNLVHLRRSPNDQHQTGFAVFPANGGDARLISYLENQLTSVRAWGSDSNRRIRHGVEVLTSTPISFVEERKKSALNELDLLRSLSTDSELIKDAESTYDLMKGGLRLKLSVEGVENYPYPMISGDAGNIWCTRSSAAQDAPLVRGKVPTLMSRCALLSDEGFLWNGGVVVTQHGEIDGKECVDLKLDNTKLKRKVNICDLRSMNDQFMIAKVAVTKHLLEKYEESIAKCRQSITKKTTVLNDEKRRKEQMERAVKDQKQIVGGNSCFRTLNALIDNNSVSGYSGVDEKKDDDNDNDNDNIQCSLCLENLGTCKGCTNGNDDEPNVALIKCGHFFCRCCLDKSSGLQCPLCRTPYNSIQDVVLIKKSERQSERGGEERMEEEELMIVTGGHNKFRWFPAASKDPFEGPNSPFRSTAPYEYCPLISREAIASLRLASGMQLNTKSATKRSEIPGDDFDFDIPGAKAQK